MNANLTQILIIQDRSGSMGSVRQATIDGFNEFVQEQKRGPGEARLRLIQFDHEYACVFDKPIQEVPTLDNMSYQPRGSTALLDAMGRAITDLGRDLKNAPESSRPSKVIAVIMTDGYENASREYSRAKVFEMVSHQKTAYKWDFIFLGANQDAIAEAHAIGISANSAMSYAATSDAVRSTYQVAAASVNRGRGGQSMSFSAQDRERAMGKTEDKKENEETEK